MDVGGEGGKGAWLGGWILGLNGGEVAGPAHPPTHVKVQAVPFCISSPSAPRASHRTPTRGWRCASGLGKKTMSTSA